ncbi:MAG: hypothetical protein IJ165_12905 [Proteobacteria bacterium]|nr:hypothetical protein [Pseudomonadota bacterium]
MKSAYKILASIGMIALSTAVGLGVRHLVAALKRRKGQDCCDAPENTDIVDSQGAEDDAESEDAEDAEDSADDAADEADDAEADEADDAEADEADEAEADDADEAEADDADDADEDASEIPPISEDGEIIEAETEIHPDTVSSSDDAGASDAEA